MKNTKRSYILDNKRVLVTGGAGVIGQELLKLLQEKNAVILSADRVQLPQISYKKLKHININFAKDSLSELISFKPQVIFHLAATFERSEETPEFWMSNWENNILLSHRIIDLARNNKNLEVFIFASSYLVYDPSLYLSSNSKKKATKLKETDFISPRNITGAAKFYAERELDFVRDHYNPSMRTINARIFRVYGYGSRDVISRWIKIALSGGNIELYNKENQFDFIFAKDVAEGLVRLAESSHASGLINLATGTPHSVQEVINILRDYIPSLRERILEVRIKDKYEASFADTEKLRKYAKWVPGINLKKGIKYIIDFERNKLTR